MADFSSEPSQAALWIFVRSPIPCLRLVTGLFNIESTKGHLIQLVHSLLCRKNRWQCPFRFRWWYPQQVDRNRPQGWGV